MLGMTQLCVREVWVRTKMDHGPGGAWVCSDKPGKPGTLNPCREEKFREAKMCNWFPI